MRSWLVRNGWLLRLVSLVELAEDVVGNQSHDETSNKKFYEVKDFEEQQQKEQNN